MAGLAPTLTKKEFQNWVKGALALLFTKDALTDFVTAEVDRHHQRLLQLVSAANMLNTCNCAMKSLPQCTSSRNHSHVVSGPRHLCSRGVCNILMDGICKDHRFRRPSWKNTDPRKWCTDAFEVAKCFFPPDGYSHTTSLLETDFNGVVSVIINNLSFSTQIQDNLATEPNVCTKARDVGREIRHTADHLLSDRDLRDYIDDLINLLCDPACLLNDPKAQVAVRKLRMLKSNDLTITEKDITEALKDNIRDAFSEEHRNLLQKITDHYSKLQRDSVAEIDNIIAVKKTELKEHAAKLTDDITRHAELKKHEIEQYDQTKEKIKGTDIWDILTFKEFRLKLDFKAELVRFYNLNESEIPASPLVEDFAVPLTELYVQPPMSAFIKPNAFGQGNKHSEKKRITSFQELFLNDNNVPYTNIYVEANAGNGKTSFTQMLAMTWCQAHRPNKLMKNKFKKKDVDTLKLFEFLFLLHLRDFQGDKCNLDELILKFVSKNLHNKEQFSEQFIANILQNKTCLVIIDGLDEWVHPETCKRTPGIPHNNFRENCTVLTTTRPWTLSTVGLPSKVIDRHLEISHLDDKTSEDLKSNAVKLLSKNIGEKERDLTDFDRKVSSVKLGDIRLIPYILLQLICIWFDGHSIGNSKCETYSNTIELTLQRGLNKKNAPTLPTGNAEHNVAVPECIRHNALCNLYWNLILKLGKLAFYASFQKIKESSLVIESTTVLKFLTEPELEFCLKIGLLSQSKDSSKVSVKRYQVFFQHKSVQEFMTALYITSEWSDKTIQLTILEVCSSVSSILEMENLFVFVCGMNPQIYTCISGEFQKNVKRDRITGTMLAYQSMQVQCFQESVRNGNDNCSIPLQYIVIHDETLTEDDVTALVKIIDCTLVHTSSGDKAIGLQSLDLYKVTMTHTNLERLYAVISQTTTLTQIKLAEILCSDHEHQDRDCDVTLDLHRLNELKMLHLEVQCKKLDVNPACVTLSLGHSSLSDISIIALTGLTCLQSLYVDHVHMTHSNLKCLYTYISQITTLTQLKLHWIRCSDHRRQFHRDCDVTLDLHRLNEMKMLHISLVPITGLHVNPACLEKLEFCSQAENMTARARATLWQNLRAAPVLSSLALRQMTSCQEMMQTISTLTQLQHLELVLIDMGDVVPRVSPAMAQLERVKLELVTMPSAAWRELLLSVGQLQHPVTVELDTCKGPSREQWQMIVNVIKTTPTLSVLPGLRIDGWYSVYASLTLKNKTV